MTKILQEDILINLYVLNTIASVCMKEKLTELKSKIERF